MAFCFSSILSNIHRALLILCILTASAIWSAQQQNAEESLAQAAEQAGKTRDAFTHYVAALQQTTQGTDADQRLREKIISLAQKLTPSPAVPREVQAHVDRGRAVVQVARDPDGLRRAEAEFEEASKLAPWLGSIYFNLGVIEEKAGQSAEAIRTFRLYLLATPSGADADRVRTRIAGLEAELQKQADLQQQKDEEARKAKAAAEARAAQEQNSRTAPPGPLDWLLGKWNMTESVAVPSVPSIRGLTAEFVKHGDEVRAVWIHEDSSREDLLRAATDILGVTRWQVLVKGITYCNGQSDQWVNAEISIAADHRTITFRQPMRVTDPDSGCPIIPVATKFELTR